jgi:hypothetical protein
MYAAEAIVYFLLHVDSIVEIRHDLFAKLIALVPYVSIFEVLCDFFCS